MREIFSIGPNDNLHVLGVKLVGMNAENAGKLLVTLLFVGVALLASALMRWLSWRVIQPSVGMQARKTKAIEG